MPEQPQIEHRDQQPFIAVAVTVSMQGLPEAVDRHFPELFGWLQAHGVEPSGAPFIRYLRIDMDRELEIELAVPTGSLVRVTEPMRADVLPAGRYVTLRHLGPYDGLVSANAALQQWAQERGIQWQMTDDSRWGARLEQYLTDPSREPDPSRWETVLAYLARPE